MARKRAVLSLVPRPPAATEHGAGIRENGGGKLADELRRIRGIRGVSLRQLEELTGISNAYLSQLETGKAEKPAPAVLYKLAKVFNVPYEALLEAAGYLTPSDTKTAKKPSAMQAALLSAKLSLDEQKQVADFISFLRSKRPKK
jgi:HTH-type transcriptional regulator, competence development regulator